MWLSGCWVVCLVAWFVGVWLFEGLVGGWVACLVCGWVGCLVGLWVVVVWLFEGLVGGWVATRKTEIQIRRRAESEASIYAPYTE